MCATVIETEGSGVEMSHADVLAAARLDYDLECAEIDEMAELASHLAAATARFVDMVWRHHERHPGDGARFIAYRCGIPGREAAEHLRVAEALQELPLTRATFGRGEITYAKVRALTRVATPVTEPQLLELAGALTASQLERALRVYRRVTAEAAHRSHELEHVSWWFAEDGSLILSARLAAEDGAVVVRALEAARERVYDRRREELARADGTEAVTGGRDFPRPVEVEALVEVAEAALSVDDDPGPTRARLVVHVDAVALASGAAGCCELEHGPVIAPETARRLGCDAEVLAQIDLEGLPVKLGRSRRTVSPAQRRLLEARDDATCCFPGCERTRHLQAHHVEHWIDGGETNIDNLALLCHLHHRLVHEGGYTVELDPGGAGLRFRTDRGPVIPTVPPKPPPGNLDRLLAEHARRGLEIGPRTNRHGAQDGITRFDLEHTLWVVNDIFEFAGRPRWDSPAGPEPDG